MANLAHLETLNRGVEAWNAWRDSDLNVRPDLRDARLRGIKIPGAHLSNVIFDRADLSGADLSRAQLRGAHLEHADLSDADLSFANGGNCRFDHATLVGADLYRADFSEAWFFGAMIRNARLVETKLDGAYARSAVFSGADLRGARLVGADMRDCDLDEADLRGAWLHGTNFTGSNLTSADLRGADMNCTLMVNVGLSGAKLTGALVYGVSAWDLHGEPAEQRNLNLARRYGKLTVDDLATAQLLHLVTNNRNLTKIFNTLTGRAVLLLGRFTEDRMEILDALRNALRDLYGYAPVVFDFDRPNARDLTETVQTLAGLCRFVVADLTKPKSVPQELEAVVPQLEIPIAPIIQAGEKPYSMFRDIDRRKSVLGIVSYKDVDDLTANLGKLVALAERKLAAIIEEKGKDLAAATPISELKGG